MNPIIFRIPSNKPFKITQQDIKHSHKFNPQLIKYGFNAEECLINIIAVASDEHHRNAIRFDQFIMPFINAHLVEITRLFNIIKPKMNVFIDDVKHINIDKINVSNNKSKKDYQLVIKIYYDKNLRGINENTYMTLIAKDLNGLLEMQNTGSSMIIQLNETKTLPMVQLIYFLSTLYSETYIIKPITSNELSTEKYLVLLNLKEKASFPIVKRDDFINSITDLSIPDYVDTSIQCFNSRLSALRLSSYERVSKYLDEKVYEGSIYQDMMKQREELTALWKERYLSNTDLSSYLDELIKDANNQCKALNPEY